MSKAYVTVTFVEEGHLRGVYLWMGPQEKIEQKAKAYLRDKIDDMYNLDNKTINRFLKEGCITWGEGDTSGLYISWPTIIED